MNTTTLRNATLFYVDFDRGFDAVYSRGDGQARLEIEAYPPVLTKSSGGRFGEAVEFSYEVLHESIWTADVLRYPAEGNFPYRQDRVFGGAIGMWLQVDLEVLRKRRLVWLDPVHLLGPGARDTGKLWMDLVISELEGSPLFRFGATLPRGMREEPENSDEGNIITVPHLTFTKDEWHQVVGAWNGINGDGKVGSLQLYFDGQLVGQLEGFEHRFDWRIGEWEIRIGLGFKGKVDDFFILDRPISPVEALSLYEAGIPFGGFCGI